MSEFPLKLWTVSAIKITFFSLLVCGLIATVLYFTNNHDNVHIVTRLQHLDGSGHIIRRPDPRNKQDFPMGLKSDEVNAISTNASGLPAGIRADEASNTVTTKQQLSLENVRIHKNITKKKIVDRLTSKAIKYGAKVDGKNFTVIYNRVPKCGSRTMVSLFDRLFRKIISTWHWQEKMSNIKLPPDQLSLLVQEYIRNLTNQIELPSVIHGHFPFIPVNRSERTVYINLIRDPLSRLVSNYYFVRFGDETLPDNLLKRLHRTISPDTLNMTFDDCVLKGLRDCTSPTKFPQISFFCGYHPNCSKNSQWSLDQAKKRIEEEYLLVGLIEDFESTLMVLEKLAPGLFTGMLEYYMELNKTNASSKATTKTRKGKPPSEEVRAIMMKKLHKEYQLYNFVKDKFEHVKKQLGI